MTRSHVCACVLCAAAAALFALLMLTPTRAHAADKPVSFIRDVAPIVKENCLACHDAKKASGKYDMSTFAKLMAGGRNDEVVLPGEPADSEFYYLMTETTGRRMPPENKGEPVTAAQAETVRRWIAQGAKLDAGLDPDADVVAELRARWRPPAPPAAYTFPVIVNALAFTPDGTQLVAGGHHELTVWSADTGELLKRVRTRAERAYDLAFLPDGTLIVAGGRPGQEGDVRGYDLSAASATEANGVPVLDGVADPKVMIGKLLDANDSVLCLAVSADGKTLASGGCDRTVHVWELPRGVDGAKLAQTIENHADWVLDVGLSADGKYLVSAARDKTAKVWNLEAEESVLTFPGHQEIVYGVGIRPDGQLGYSVGADKQVRTWKPNGDGKQVAAGGGHAADVFKLALNGAGDLLATGSADKTVRLWSADKLTATKTLSGLGDYVFALAFSPDGKRVAGGAYNGEVRVWNVADGKELAAFNASPGYEANAQK